MREDRLRSGQAAALVCIVLMCASAFLSQPAQAQEPAPQPAAPTTALGPKPKVLLLPTDSVQSQVNAIISDRVDDSARKRLREGNAVVLMPSFAEIRKKLSGQGVASAVLAQAEQQYASGIGLLTAGENAAAMQKFKQAVELMEQNIVDLTNYAVLTDALSNLGLAYFLSGYDLDGRKTIEGFAHIKPDETLNPDKFSPELIEVYKSEAAKVKKAGPGKLVIKSSAPGAKVFIDGVEKGVTPLTVTDVGFGYHYMVVRAATGEVYGEKIRVRGKGKEQEFNAELKKQGVESLSAARDSSSIAMPSYYTDLLTTLRSGKFSKDGLAPYLSELAKQSGAEFITWMLIHKEGSEYVTTAFAYRASDGELVKASETRFNFELSNLNVGVGTLSAALADAVMQMPSELVVASLELGPAKAPPVVVDPGPKDPTDPTDPEAKDPVVIKKDDKKEDDKLVVLAPPPVVEPAGESNTLMYVGIGAASALVIGGAIVGGILLFGGDDPAPGGFNAEVSW